MAAFLWDRAAGDWSWIIFTTSKSGYEKKRGEKQTPYQKMTQNPIHLLWILVLSIWKQKGKSTLEKPLAWKIATKLTTPRPITFTTFGISVKNDSWYSGQRALAIIISPRDVKATGKKKKELKKQGVSPEREIMLLLRKRARLFP